MALFACDFGHAQSGTDALRAQRIEWQKQQYVKSVKAEIASYTPLAGGHIFLKTEVEGNVSFQREFNEYLSNFHDLVSTLAEFYGVYYELNLTSKHISEFARLTADTPTNTLAVGLSSNRNKVYRQLFFIMGGIGTDVAKLWSNKYKMTEQEVSQMITEIRKKLRTFNQLMNRLNLSIQYTSMTDVWNEIFLRVEHHDKTKRNVILDNCMNTWKNCARNASRIR